MNIYPGVLDSTLSPHALEATLDIRETLSCFEGHFSGHPIAPGVAQISWVVHFAQEFLALTAPVIAVERLKFTQVIHPKQSIRLRLQYQPEKNAVQFWFDAPSASDSKIVFSQGWLIYEAQ